MATMIAFAMLLLFLENRKWLNKICLTITFLFVLFCSNSLQQLYWDSKFNAAVEFVKKKGGTPFPQEASRQAHHEVWHPLLCGLGDFDQKYGFAWNDIVVFGKILPILKSKHGLDFKWSNGYALNDWWDANHIYEKRFNEYPQYHEATREMFFSLIKSDPIWYLEIIGKRLLALSDKISPIDILAFNHEISFKSYGFILLILALALVTFIKVKNNEPIDLMVVCLLLSLSTSISSIMVTTANGATFGATYHYLALSIILTVIIQKLIQKMRKK